MKLHYGDMTDSSCLVKIIVQVRPNEIYNLAAQSHVKVSQVVYHIRSFRDKNFVSQTNITFFVSLFAIIN